MDSFISSLVIPHLEIVEKALKNNSFNVREEAYIKAFKHFASGDLVKCTDEFVAILRDFPLGECTVRCMAPEYLPSEMCGT